MIMIILSKHVKAGVCTSVNLHVIDNYSGHKTIREGNILHDMDGKRLESSSKLRVVFSNNF